MNQCVNLKNLYSKFNNYTNQDINSLYNLKKICSYYDKYNNKESCFLNDLFINNKLEYVDIYNYQEFNIIDSKIVFNNIANLYYLNICLDNDKYNIMFKIVDKFPK